MRIRIGAWLLNLGWRLLPESLRERLDDRPHDFSTERFEAKEQSIAGYLECPDCGEEVPIGIAPLRLGQDDDGQQVAFADLQMDDLWAHAWTHGKEGPD